jgi:hypothetical protein
MARTIRPFPLTPPSRRSLFRLALELCPLDTPTAGGAPARGGGYDLAAK